MKEQEHLEKTIEQVKSILTDATKKISSLQSGERITQSEISQELGSNYMVNKIQMQALLGLLFTDAFPGVEYKMGPKGGIHKL